MVGGPPGWPPSLPPPGTQEFAARAPGWLFELCPPRYRDHPVLRRQPRVLAWLAVRHVQAESRAVIEAIAAARAELGGTATARVDARALAQVLLALDQESTLLMADLRAARLVEQALSDVRFVPRL